MTTENMLIDATRNPVVFIKDGEAFANSADIAAFFAKPHEAIICEIESLLLAVPDLSGRSIVRAESGSKAFDLTKDGFSLLGRHFHTQRDVKKAVAYYHAFGMALPVSASSTTGRALIEGTPLTMSSTEISELTGKRHDHVTRDIRKMLDDLGENFPQIWGKVASAVGRPMEVANLPKNLTITLVAGYNVKMRKRIIDRWLELEQTATGDTTIDLSGSDVLANYSGRVEGELVQFRGFISKEVGGIRGAVLHYVKEYVVNPLAGLRQYLDDRFRAIHQRDAMLLGHAANTTAEMQVTRKEVGTVLTMARRSLDPEAFIRPEWCDIDDTYVLAGFDHVPRRNSLSATVSRSLDAFCKENNRQQDMRTWRHAGRNSSYWRKTAVTLWLKSHGSKMIKVHCTKHAAPAQGVIPFRKPEGV